MGKPRFDRTSGSLQSKLFLQAGLSLKPGQVTQDFFHLGLEHLKGDCTILGNLMHPLLMVKKLFTIVNTSFQLIFCPPIIH